MKIINVISAVLYFKTRDAAIHFPHTGLNLDFGGFVSVQYMIYVKQKEKMWKNLFSIW